MNSTFANTVNSSNFSSNFSNASLSDENPFPIYNYIKGAEFIVGLILNCLTIFVCVLSQQLRQTPCFIIAIFISVSNIIILSTTSLPDFVDQLTTLSFDSNLAWCKMSYFFEMFSYNWAAWLLVFWIRIYISLFILSCLIRFFFKLIVMFLKRFYIRSEFISTLE